MAKIKTKKRGFGLEVKVIQGTGGSYIVFRAKNGSYYVFTEVDAKKAARDCGAEHEANTRQMWKKIWDKN